MPKITYYSVFYTRLITTLEEIQRYIGLAATNSEAIKDHSSILDSARSIKNLLDVSTWSPFPDYQSLVEKLELKEKWNDFCLALDALNRPSKEYSRKDVLETLDIMLKRLLAFSHLLNFMDLINKDMYAEEKKLAHAIAESLADVVSVMEENNNDKKDDENIANLKAWAEGAQAYDAKTSYQQIQDCHGKTTVVNTNSAPVTSSVYTELVKSFNAFKDDREFQAFIIKLFSTFNEFDPASVYTGTALDKNNIFDQKLAAKRFIIEQVNIYKTLFLDFVDSLKRSHDEEDEFVPVSNNNNAL